ncbi:uncharacterized protein DUF975 [Alkalibaculum bacchi]|uniref:Uncharacterized protein DUF975 n=2 Tax=Alkalibaculum bacchi TaxID=645887 RepID=A0A366I8Y7_9FIRM|nr:uncharacterized protein DUF975 [Alkalibaculum bacchi]
MMWTRAELKTRAKSVLKVTYWKSFLVSIILAIVGGSGGGSSSMRARMGNETGANFLDEYNYSNGDFNGFGNEIPFDSIMDGEMLAYLLAVFGIIALIALLVGIALRIFLGYPLEMGGRKFFVQSSRYGADLNYLGYGFTKGNYLNIVKTMFFRDLYIFFWSLLLIIPGIIKSYSYSMVPYILADNPQMETDVAIQMSMNMTKGHKFNMWVLDLSFIGWYILGMIALGIGILFVLPYENATKAELYIELRKEAIESGLISAHDLVES